MAMLKMKYTLCPQLISCPFHCLSSTWLPYSVQKVISVIRSTFCLRTVYHITLYPAATRSRDASSFAVSRSGASEIQIAIKIVVSLYTFPPNSKQLLY